MPTINELIIEHNELAKVAGKPELAHWKKPKKGLEAKIRSLKETRSTAPVAVETYKDVVEIAERQPLPPAYQHPSTVRCQVRRSSNNRPIWLTAPCGGIMKVRRTMEDGRIKQWECPKCGSKKRTTGKEI